MKKKLLYMSVYRRVSSTFSFITSSTSITSTVSLSTSTIVEITLSSPRHLILYQTHEISPNRVLQSDRL
ncbi:unnamed protein product [Rotaria sordida]|uniref:Uncharacterized protein n=1 Tax=Rotaria sordida TaxID=392033 RepID=A0A813YF19_9BILA|nr:unnamed protein product [Rotaria sordida]CAF0888261.1 unnamed protein product [Rotaria sordida]